jgi:LysR family transcriptional regulator, nitrogen assimilation regulatory protein
LQSRLLLAPSQGAPSERNVATSAPPGHGYWEAMNVKQLRYFLQVAELGSVTRAAEVLHIAQPALSRQIRSLEEDLDATLLHRSERGITLTEAGECLRESAVELLRHFDRVRSDVRDRSGDPRGELTIALPPSVSALLAFPVIQRFRTSFPNVLLRVFEGSSGVLDAWSMVAQGKADLAVVGSSEPLASLDAYPFIEEPMCLIGPAQAGLSLDKPLTLEDLVDRPMIMTSRPNVGRMIVDSAMAERNLRLNVALEVNTRHLVLKAVESGLGFTTLPLCSGCELLERGAISMAPIEGMMISWLLIKGREQGLSIAGQRLQLMLREVAHEQISGGRWPLAKLKGFMPPEGGLPAPPLT